MKKLEKRKFTKSHNKTECHFREIMSGTGNFKLLSGAQILTQETIIISVLIFHPFRKTLVPLPRNYLIH